LNPTTRIPKISSSKIVQIESEMIGGGHMGKNQKSYQIVQDDVENYKFFV